MRYLVLVFWLILSVSESFSQTETFNYNIIHRNKEVGVLNATRTISGNQITYKSETKTTLSLIMDFVIVFENNLTTLDGALEHSDMSVFVNKKNYGTTTTKRTGNKYVMDNDGDEIVIEEFPISYCGSMFVFFEPKGEVKSFSEKQGNFHDVKYLGNNVYEKTDPKGRINKYYYENGKLTKAEIDAGLIEFKIVKAD